VTLATGAPLARHPWWCRRRRICDWVGRAVRAGIARFWLRGRMTTSRIPACRQCGEGGRAAAFHVERCRSAQTRHGLGAPKSARTTRPRRAEPGTQLGGVELRLLPGGEVPAPCRPVVVDEGSGVPSASSSEGSPPVRDVSPVRRVALRPVLRRLGVLRASGTTIGRCRGGSGTFVGAAMSQPRTRRVPVHAGETGGLGFRGGERVRSAAHA
jgi:hypothetical protein